MKAHDKPGIDGHDAHGFYRPQTTQEAVLIELRRRILRRELVPGAPIVQEHVAQDLGVSRVPVREALRLLEGEGLVRYEAHRGYAVAKLDFAELSEMYHLRRVLETEAARIAIARLDDQHIERMAAAQEEMKAAALRQDLGTLGEANRRFHFVVFEASGMAQLSRLVQQLWDASDPYRTLYFANSDARQRIETEHSRILDAVVSRDADALVREQDLHRGNALNMLESTLDTQSIPR